MTLTANKTKLRQYFWGIQQTF